MEEQVAYDIGVKTFYTVFRSSLDQYTMFRWVNGYFLMLIGINLLLTSLARSPLREKLHFLFFIQISGFITIFMNADWLLKDNFIFSKTVLLSVYLVMTVIHILFIYRLKLEGPLKRIEYYKMILYLVVSIFIWNKFFF